MLRTTPAYVCLAIMACALHGCERSPKNVRGGIESQAGITRSAKEGSVSVLLTVSPKAPGVSENVRARLEIISDTSVTIIEPDYGDVLSEGDRVFQYRVREVETERAKPIGNGRLRWVYTYDLRFVLAGEYELPGAEVSFTTVGPDDAARESSISTEPITLLVTAPEQAAFSDADLRTVTRLDPVDLPWAWPAPKGLIAMAIAAVVFVVALILWRRRRDREKTEVPIPADVWARRQLAALLADELLEKGRVQEFYYRISAIVRGYIEGRFGVSAPEMTTEEFLAETASDNRFGDDTSAELDKFLCACDMVKYAKHLPGPSECEAVLEAARDFVERTRERVAPDGLRDGWNFGPPAEERAA
ncbi:MAG: hypothetical protein IID33_06585 [Planctomycetes bacterium]|nr:hypothetical protein [Planctomycetota bacterium]